VEHIYKYTVAYADVFNGMGYIKQIKCICIYIIMNQNIVFNFINFYTSIRIVKNTKGGGGGVEYPLPLCAGHWCIVLFGSSVFSNNKKRT